MKKAEWLAFWLTCTLIASVLIFEFSRLPDKNYHFSTFYVRLGDGLLIQTPDSHFIAIDGGIDGAITEKIFTRQSFFDRRIDGLVLTHADSDHLTGAYFILQNFPVKQIFLSGVKSKNALYEAFIDLAAVKGAKIVYLDGEGDFAVGGAYFEVLYPDHNLVDQEIKSTNTNSVVLRAHLGDKTVLLTGDSTKTLEKGLVMSGDALGSDLLKVGHHGSKNASISEFLAAVQPQFAVISAGRENPYGHPHYETLTRLQDIGAETFNTGQKGDIEYIIGQNSSSFVFYPQ